MPYEKEALERMAAELEKELKTLTFHEKAKRKSGVANKVLAYLKYISEYANEVEVKENYSAHKTLIQGGLWKIYSRISKERDQETQNELTTVCNSCYNLMGDIWEKLES